MKEIFFVFVGGGTGSAVRFMVSLLWKHIQEDPRWQGLTMPWPTLVVNVIGCFLIGLFYSMSERWGLSQEARLLLTTGFCGGLTTFSTLSYEGLEMLRSGDYIGYGIYITLTIVLGLLAALLPSAIH